MNAAEAILGPALARGLADKPALLAGERTVTYGELDGLVGRFGNALAARGVARENRVLLVMKDSPELVAAYLGAMRIGAVAIALNVLSIPAQIAFVLADSRCRLALADAEFVAALDAAGAEAGSAPPVFLADELAAGAAPDCPPAAMSDDDMAFWIYTSGTTGTPKAAVHLQHDVLPSDRYLRDGLGLGPDDRLFGTSKLFFAYTLGTCLFGALRLGATTILHGPWPTPEAVAEVVARHRPTAMFSVPTFYRNLLHAGVAEGEAFRAVRRYVSAGERLPEPVLEGWRAATGTLIAEGMGTSETIYMILQNPPDAVRPGASGVPAPGVEVDLRDEAGSPVTEPGRHGVLWARMPSTADRYWNQQARSQAAFVGPWFRTGDIYCRDQDGYFHHQGRADDMLKIAGQWVSPADIEAPVLALDVVADTACVGVPDTDGLVRPELFVVLAETAGREAAEAAIAAALETLPRLQRPRRIRLVDALPRTATGKIQRFRLRALAGM